MQSSATEQRGGNIRRTWRKKELQVHKARVLQMKRKASCDGDEGRVQKRSKNKQSQCSSKTSSPSSPIRYEIITMHLARFPLRLGCMALISPLRTGGLLSTFESSAEKRGIASKSPGTCQVLPWSVSFDHRRDRPFVAAIAWPKPLWKSVKALGVPAPANYKEYGWKSYVGMFSSAGDAREAIETFIHEQISCPEIKAIMFE